MKMKGRDLVDLLRATGGIAEKRKGASTGTPICFEVCDVIVAGGECENDVMLDEDSIEGTLELLREDPSLKEFFDEECFVRLSELVNE